MRGHKNTLKKIRNFLELEYSPKAKIPCLEPNMATLRIGIVKFGRTVDFGIIRLR